MSKFKGTKGKWILRENFCTIASNENNLLARVYDAKGNALHPEIEQDFKTVKANAKLIASAPEMLEELNETIVDLKILKGQIIDANKTNHLFDGMPELIEKWIERKQQLIKKATE
jgi:hypothetical protein